MIDFKKLLDPAVQAELRARREAEDAAREAKDAKIRAALDVFAGEAKYELLTANERSFIRSCDSRARSYLSLSDKQEAWLFDLASRHETPASGEELGPAP